MTELETMILKGIANYKSNNRTFMDYVKQEYGLNVKHVEIIERSDNRIEQRIKYIGNSWVFIYLCSENDDKIKEANLYIKNNGPLTIDMDTDVGSVIENAVDKTLNLLNPELRQYTWDEKRRAILFLLDAGYLKKLNDNFPTIPQHVTEEGENALIKKDAEDKKKKWHWANIVWKIILGIFSLIGMVSSTLKIIEVVKG